MYPYNVVANAYGQALVEPETPTMDLTLIGQRPVTNGQKIEQEVELTVEFGVGEYSKEDFFPSEISVCLPDGVEPVLGTVT